MGYGLNLLMKRKVYARVQVMCDNYEDKFKEKVPTASVLNVLLAEALVNRGLIPSNFIQEEYGCANPIEEGFTASARQEKKPLEVMQENSELERMSKTFSRVLEQWADHPDEKWRMNWINKANQYRNQIPEAAKLLDLAESELPIEELSDFEQVDSSSLMGSVLVVQKRKMY